MKSIFKSIISFFNSISIYTNTDPLEEANKLLKQVEDETRKNNPHLYNIKPLEIKISSDSYLKYYDHNHKDFNLYNGFERDQKAIFRDFEKAKTKMGIDK